jgi:phosphatidylglycerophosphate synthase
MRMIDSFRFDPGTRFSVGGPRSFDNCYRQGFFVFDSMIRPHIDKPLARVATHLVRWQVSANSVTAMGFLLGMGAAGFIASGQFIAGLVLFLASRVLDGLDGAVARQTRLTDLGGYLDITLDFIVYASMVLGFALADPPRNALAAAFLTTSFMAPAATSLAYAIFAAKRGITTEIRGPEVHVLPWWPD